MQLDMRINTLTGSRAFGVASQHSDWDYVSMYTPPPDGRWKQCGMYQCGDEFVVYSDGNRQVIVCCSKGSFDRWMRAHRHCVIERPKSKARRKVIFDHYMYGTPLDRQTPLPRHDRWWFRKKLDGR